MAVSPTGSRNGIIAWAVASTILGVGSLIWAVISQTQANKVQDELTTTQTRFGKVVSTGELTGGDVTELEAIKNDQTRGYGGLTLLSLSRQQTRDLTQFLGGSSISDDRAARAAVQAELDKAREDIAKASAPAEGSTATQPSEAVIDSSSVLSTVRGLVTNAASLREARNQALAELAEANEKLAQAEKDKQALVEERAAAVVAVVEGATAAEKAAQAAEANTSTQLNTVTEEAQKRAAEYIRGTDEAATSLTAANQRVAQLRNELNEIKTQLEQYRVKPDQILTHADGTITKLTDVDRVAISLGRGDGIAPGMTFEVYDRLGIPRAASDDPSQDATLKGKASIEVISVQPGISICKIVRLTPGAAITEGDPIANLVYDKNVKFNFYVYGNFNLDYKGEATERDAEIVRRLISGWGGQIGSDLNAKTDFVILGEEPVVPSYTQDQLTREPEKAFEKERAEQALEAYSDIRARAAALNIPILNQTRFLYMVGYYDEAQR